MGTRKQADITQVEYFIQEMETGCKSEEEKERENKGEKYKNR